MAKGKPIFENQETSWQRKIVSFTVSFPFLIKSFHRKRMPRQLNKILVIQWDYLGDIITSTPALKMLREKFPLAEIHLLTSPENKLYIDGFPFVNQILYLRNPFHLGRTRFKLTYFLNCVYNLRKEKYDFIIELTGRLPNQIFLPFLRSKYTIGYDPVDDFFYLDKRITSTREHQIEKNLDVIGAIVPLEKRPLLALWNPATDRDRLNIEKLFNKLKIKGSKCVIIHSITSWEPRRWPIERWAGVTDFLLNSGMKVLFIGKSQESQQIEQIRKLTRNKDSFNLAGTLNINEIISMMEKSKLFIGGDSGPMHLAAIANLKGVVIFGPGNPARWGYPSLHTIMYKKLQCSPCPQWAFRKRCVRNLPVCEGLLCITSAEVIEACKKFW